MSRIRVFEPFPGHWPGKNLKHFIGSPQSCVQSRHSFHFRPLGSHCFSRHVAQLFTHFPPGSVRVLSPLQTHRSRIVLSVIPLQNVSCLLCLTSFSPFSQVFSKSAELAKLKIQNKALIAFSRPSPTRERLNRPIFFLFFLSLWR